MPLTRSTVVQPGSRRNDLVMVTGAAGFIGAHAVRRLLNDGIRVLGIVRNTDPEQITRLRSALTKRRGAQLNLVACDLHDSPAVNQLIVHHRPTSCIHAAWQLDPIRYRDDPINDTWVETSLHVLEALLTHGCTWIGVLGTCIEPRENEAASCRYAAAKAVLRRRMTSLLAHRGSASDFGLCWWKLFQPYGPGEPALRLIPSLIAAFENRQPFLVEHPHEVRDFIHADDIAAAFSYSLVHRIGGVFDLGSGVGHRILDVAQTAAGLLGAHQLLRVSNHSSREETQQAPRIADVRSLTATTGWHPEVDLRTGLQRMIDEVRTHECMSA